MKHPKNEQKDKNLNNSMQLSQKLFSSQILLTDYSMNNFNDNNIPYKKIKIRKLNNNLNKSSIVNKKKNRIVANYNFPKNQTNIITKNIFSNYVTKTSSNYKNNTSIDRNAFYINEVKNYKKNIYISKGCSKGRSLNNSINANILPNPIHNKEIKEFKLKFKNSKNSISKDKIYDKSSNARLNQNLNLTNYSIDAPRENLNKSPEEFNLTLANQLDNIKIKEDIIIKRKYVNTTKNRLNKKIFGKINLNDINNYNNSNIQKNNINMPLSNNNSNNNSIILNRRKINKKINSSSTSSSKFYEKSLKDNNIYSNIKKLESLKNNMNDQINEIINSRKKIKIISDNINIRKNELIYEIIENSLFKFAALLENPKQKDFALEIIKNLNDFFKRQSIIINNTLKKNGDLNIKLKKYIDVNRIIEKENSLLLNKIDALQKEIKEMENQLKKFIKLNENYNNDKTNNNLNQNNNLNEKRNQEKENDNNDENESSINTEELESIRFFDKIIMKKLSFSKAHIPELQIKRIKKYNIEENKFNEKSKYNKFKNNKNENNYKKNIFIGLRKEGSKSSETILYSKTAENKKNKNNKRLIRMK